MLRRRRRLGQLVLSRVARDALHGPRSSAYPRQARDLRSLRLFNTVVPDFPHRRETGERIWDLYQAGDKDGGPQHREAAREFVRELVRLIGLPSVR